MTTPSPSVYPAQHATSPSALQVHGEWLVEETGQHDCVGGDAASSGAHEPHCGLEPVIRIQELEALLQLTLPAVDPARLDALPISTRDALVAHVLQWMGRVGYVIDAPGQPRTRIPEPEAMRNQAELTEEERVALPTECHRPVWNGMGWPYMWVCAVCWGDGTMTSWPCEPARAGGLVLVRALGLGYHW